MLIYNRRKGNIKTFQLSNITTYNKENEELRNFRAND